MSQVNDCKLAALRAQGYLGAVDDMERAWGLDNNLPNGCAGVPWHNALTAAGYTGPINDMEFQFWCIDGGTLTPVSSWLAEDATPWQAELAATNWETEI